ncbi:hypothetical protein [Adhaeribacter rhizoryzae]|uniref:Uncharacterized protein n=1 Tax=Adhaeribacter rhizoryzae TaxID=2607907 RepID=A0A5M6CV11_9BACT|nr:hypothetical protein [Adhaeribacter rhizoryzae]KAA5539031.1 hypothetical protein F0145_25165 [Adhaeribacter rhizoryzae]
MFDTKKNQEVRLDVTLEYTTPSPHLLLVLFNAYQTEILADGRESKPFGEYKFRALHHIAGVKFKYEGRIYALTLGFYLDKTSLIAVILPQVSNQQESRFANASSTNDSYYAKQLLIDTQEHEWLVQMGLSSRSFSEHVTHLIETENASGSRLFYDIDPDNHLEFQFQHLVGEEQFQEFMEENELLEDEK